MDQTATPQRSGTESTPEPPEQAVRAASAYWQARLAGCPPLSTLPTDFPRPQGQSFRGGSVPLALDAEGTQALRALAARHQMTLVMVVVAGMATLLHRRSGQDELVLGLPSLGHDPLGTEPMRGLFARWLPLRLDLGADPDFEALLPIVRHEILAACAHDTLPLDRLVHELGIERSAGTSPLVQVAIAPQPPGEPPPARGLPSQRIHLEAPRDAFDLTLLVWEHAAGLTAELEYATDLFQHETAVALAEQLKVLLGAVAQDPARPLSRLPLLSADQQRELLRTLRTAPAMTTKAVSLPDQIAAQAARTPDAVAVLEPGGRLLRYAQLDAQASQIARALGDLGVGPGVQVALCAERSLECIAAILGILRAGGAYLPLDPRYPSERLAFMLRDAVPAVLLTQRALLKRLPAHSARCVLLDGDARPFRPYSRAPLPCRAAPADLAYTLYPSGSTGRPAGVLVEHRSLTFLAEAQRAAFDVRPGDRVLQLAPLGSDASIAELATTLSAGATLCLPPPGPAPVGRELLRLLAIQRITMVTMPPSVLAPLGAEAARELLDSVRTLIAAGEPYPVDRVTRLAPGLRSFQVYGPTECTVCLVLGDRRAGEPPAPIGRPLPGARVYILDRHAAPVPVGVPGEICVGGVGVARGYLDRPELTAERFLPDPFAGEPGARIYRTGDLARWRSDGCIELLGRVDRRLKPHGCRSESGETESVLREHPLIRAAPVPLGRSIEIPAEPISEHLPAWRAPHDAPLRGAAGADAQTARPQAPQHPEP